MYDTNIASAVELEQMDAMQAEKGIKEQLISQSHHFYWNRPWKEHITSL